MRVRRFDRRFALVAVLTAALVPACAAPDAIPKLASAKRAQPAEPVQAEAEQAAAPAAAAPPALPQQEFRVIGDRPIKAGAAQSLPVLPRETYAGAACPPALPYGAIGPWAPPGIKGPYPYDEYLHDGGDAEQPVSVSPEWRVDGLNVEDTVAHYDTLDGRTKVEPSNCTYIYAPRFSSVRSVVALVSNDFIDGPTRLSKPLTANRIETRAFVRTNVEQQQPIGQTANLRANIYQRDQGNEVYSTQLIPFKTQAALLPFEDLSIIRSGALQNNDKARLAEAADAAIAWTKDVGVQVQINRQQAVIQTGAQRAQVIYTVKEPENGRLRICKIASTPAANPGEFVEFTLRYDNVGDQVLGNIVILDSLTARLEYVAESATSSRKAVFSTAMNGAESLELRWEIDEPVQPGDGGIVRFRCKVR
jgi:uncharacterized repeat protein (TIGR01451 family)